MWWGDEEGVGREDAFVEVVAVVEGGVCRLERVGCGEGADEGGEDAAPEDRVRVLVWRRDAGEDVDGRDEADDGLVPVDGGRAHGDVRLAPGVGVVGGVEPARGQAGGCLHCSFVLRGGAVDGDFFSFGVQCGKCPLVVQIEWNDYGTKTLQNVR